MESISSIKADMSRLRMTAVQELLPLLKGQKKNISRMKMNLKELMNFRLLKENIVIINIFAVLMK